MPDQRTSSINGARRGDCATGAPSAAGRTAAGCERAQRTGDSPEKRAERRAGRPTERSVLAGIALDGLRIFGGQRRR